MFQAPAAMLLFFAVCVKSCFCKRSKDDVFIPIYSGCGIISRIYVQRVCTVCVIIKNKNCIRML
jgi:hypothetical protein